MVIRPAAGRNDVVGAVVGNVSAQRNHIASLIHLETFPLSIRENGILNHHLCVAGVRSNRGAVVGGVYVASKSAIQNVDTQIGVKPKIKII